MVTTSSTIRQRSPGSSGGPSTQRWSPCSLRSLRTKKALTSAPAASAAQATGSAPIVRPPTAVAPSSAAVAGHQLAHRREARRAQRRPLGVDVVLGLAPARERDARRSRARARVAPRPAVRVRRSRAGVETGGRRGNEEHGGCRCYLRGIPDPDLRRDRGSDRGPEPRAVRRRPVRGRYRRPGRHRARRATRSLFRATPTSTCPRRPPRSSASASNGTRASASTSTTQTTSSSRRSPRSPPRAASGPSAW